MIDGEGVLHLGGADTPLGPGSYVHLPPLQEHCLENTGPTPMRVLGVFHRPEAPRRRRPRLTIDRLGVLAPTD